MFGLGWLGGWAKITKLYLLNILVMCGADAPVFVSVHDCAGADHMVHKEKDADLIMKYLQKRLKSTTHYIFTLFSSLIE